MTEARATSSSGALLGLCARSCVLFLTDEAYSQDSRNRTAQYVHDLWRTADGLPVNSVQAIRQARDGYLWIGTQEGHVRFDGARFTVFDSANTAAITNNYFTSLLVDREGGIWAGTFGGGVVRYWHGVLAAHDLGGSTKNRRVRCLYEDGRGSVWIGSDAGLTRWLDGKATTFDVTNGLPGGAVMSLCEDRDGDLWIGTRTGGLSRLRGESTRPGRSRYHLTAGVSSSTTPPSVCLCRGGSVSGISSKGSTENGSMRTRGALRTPGAWSGARAK